MLALPDTVSARQIRAVGYVLAERYLVFPDRNYFLYYESSGYIASLVSHVLNPIQSSTQFLSTQVKHPRAKSRHTCKVLYLHKAHLVFRACNHSKLSLSLLPYDPIHRKSKMASAWYCCCCNFGPHDGTLHTSCMQCEITRCAQCSAQEMTLNTNIHSDSTSCGVASAYPAAVPTSLSRTPTLKPTSQSIAVPELSSLEALPQTAYTGILLTSLSGIRERGGTKMYICCGCRDGPKVYAHQPQCVICSHRVCSSCIYVK